MKPRKSDENSFFSSRHMEEKQWVRRVREEGDRRAFENIFRAYYKQLHGFAYSYVFQRETAEDIVQTIFLRIWAQRESWNPPGTVKQYLFAAVRNEALNTLRHRKIAAEAGDALSRDSEKQLHPFLEDPDTETGVKRRNSGTEIREHIERGIENLPPRCRQIFLLNRRNGLTYTEIADYLGVSVNTVNTQMGRALKSLRDYLVDYLPGLVAAGISKIFF